MYQLVWLCYLITFFPSKCKEILELNCNLAPFFFLGMDFMDTRHQNFRNQTHFCDRGDSLTETERERGALLYISVKTNSALWPTSAGWMSEHLSLNPTKNEDDSSPDTAKPRKGKENRGVERSNVTTDTEMYDTYIWSILSYRSEQMAKDPYCNAKH